MVGNVFFGRWRVWSTKRWHDTFCHPRNVALFCVPQILCWDELGEVILSISQAFMPLPPYLCAFMITSVMVTNWPTCSTGCPQPCHLTVWPWALLSVSLHKQLHWLDMVIGGCSCLWMDVDMRMWLFVDECSCLCMCVIEWMSSGTQRQSVQFPVDVLGRQ